MSTSLDSIGDGRSTFDQPRITGRDQKQRLDDAAPAGVQVAV